jgi:hypothetical protein
VVFGKLGKGFFIKNAGRVDEYKKYGLVADLFAFFSGESCLKVFAVDAFVYESAVAIAFSGFLAIFCQFIVNFPEVSL